MRQEHGGRHFAAEADGGRALGRGGLGQGSAVQAVFEDGFNGPISGPAQRQSPPTGLFQAIRTVGFAQAQDSQAVSKPLLGMGSGTEDIFYQAGGGGTGFSGPADQTLGRPGEVLLMGLGHMLRQRGEPPFPIGTYVGSHPAAFKEGLDGFLGEADLDFPSEQLIRCRVVMAVDLDMVVVMDMGLSPVGINLKPDR